MAANSQGGYVDPNVKKMTPDEAKEHYKAFVKRSVDIYEQNKAFLEENLFSTAEGGPDTIAIDRNGRPKEKQQSESQSSQSVEIHIS